MMTTTQPFTVWNRVLQSVEKRLNRQIFDAWFKPIEFESFDEKENVLYVRASELNRDWVTAYYSELLSTTLTELDLKDLKIDWCVSENKVLENASIEKQAAGLFGRVEFAPAQISVSEKNRSEYSPKSPSASFANIEPIENSLNPKYTFNTFVVGSCNQLAHAAAIAAVESPGKTYNPLYLYGGVGLGKTHLMHALGHSVKERNPHFRVVYLSAEKFMNELINAIRYDKTQSFRDKYRSIDVLLVDDVQFLAGKERTQEEFFHTFNALHNDQKQLVISSDCPPREIPSLEERLHSRFEWGLIADLEPPDLETKVAILKRKADLDGVTLPDDVAFFIASKVKNNIRELEGSLVRLVAISSLRGLPISKMLAQDALRNIVEDSGQDGVTMERIGKTVSAHFKLTVEELKSKNNARQIAVPRQIAMYLCKRLTKHSFPEIGREFGGKHHTTVIHSVEKIDGLINEDQNFHRTVSELIDSLCG